MTTPDDTSAPETSPEQTPDPGAHEAPETRSAEANGLAAVDYTAVDYTASELRTIEAGGDSVQGLLDYLVSAAAAEELRALERGAIYGFPNPTPVLRDLYSCGGPGPWLADPYDAAADHSFVLDPRAPSAPGEPHTEPSPDDVANVGDALAALDPARFLALRACCERIADRGDWMPARAPGKADIAVFQDGRRGETIAQDVEPWALELLAFGPRGVLGLLDAIDQLAHDLRNAQAAALGARELLDEAKATIAALRSGATR